MFEQPILAQVSWQRVLGTLQKSSVFFAFDEEAISATLLSQVSRDMFCLNERLGSGTSEDKPFYFGTFNKYGKAKDPVSEAGSGADFALIVGVDESRVRLAVFQAKKAELIKDKQTSERWCADIARRPKNKSRPSQLTMLLAAGRRISGLSTHDSNLPEARRLSRSSEPTKVDFAKDLHWIHYLVYAPEFMGSLPVSSVTQEEILIEVDKSKSRNVIELSRFSWLSNLIQTGVITPADESCEGWLTLDRGDVRKMIGPILDMMTTIFVDDRGDGRSLDADAIEEVPTRSSQASEIMEMHRSAPKASSPGMRS